MAIFISRTVWGVAILGLAGAALVLAAAPAAAHDNAIILGNNKATITANHTLLTVCDNEDDGLSVQAEVRTSPTLLRRFTDTYNGAGNCSLYRSLPGFTGRWRLCEGFRTCSPWQPV